MPRFILAAIQVRLGRLAEAQAIIKTFLKNSPDYTLEKERLNVKAFKKPADAKQIVEDLRGGHDAVGYKQFRRRHAKLGVLSLRCS